jgi:ankyrin repeat protein
LIASQNCYTDIVNLLLNKKANVNLRNNDGKTAYDFAKTDEIKKLFKEASGFTLTIIYGEKVKVIPITKSITITL